MLFPKPSRAVLIDFITELTSVLSSYCFSYVFSTRLHLSLKEKEEKKGQESYIQESGFGAEQAAESDSDIEVLGKDFLRE